jgi:hypothetical protein
MRHSSSVSERRLHEAAFSLTLPSVWRRQVSDQLHESALYRQMVDLERKIDALVDRRKARAHCLRHTHTHTRVRHRKP